MSGETRTTITASGGIGLGGAVFVLFLALKLIGVEPVASWSWWWVTCPLWIPFLVFVAILLIAGVVALIASVVK